MWNPFKKITYQSPINGLITLGEQKKHKAIFAGGVTQSGGELVPMWETIIEKLHTQKTPVKNFLLLGVGAGMVLRIVREYYPKATMTGIDIDPIMKEIAINQFEWKDTKTQKIIVADALTWLRNGPKNHFDFIVVDLFIGARNTPRTRDETFLQTLKKSLTKDGILLYNADFQEGNDSEYKNMVKRLKKLFPYVEAVFSYPLNKVFLLKK